MQPTGPNGTVRCPSCTSRELETIYRVDGIPLHSCILVPTAEAARDFPCGDLELAYCRTCGFLTNLRFDQGAVSYSPDYEETQHFSPTFSKFAHALASGWIERYGLRNRTILEIGCGKGEFLALMCELGDNRGIGVDPACRPERHDEEINRRITWIRDLYSADLGHMDADVIICRHTLEHIHDTRGFVRSIRDAIGDRDCLVLFELPDTTRVLRERAFWDIYYEHCSYFTAGSLARLFRQSCFEVTALERAYDDQYLLLAARPSATPTLACLDLEHDLETHDADVASFVAAHQEVLSGWHRKIETLAGGGKRPVIWGAGSKSVAFCSTLGLNGEIDYLVDINPYKQGMFLPGSGHPVVAPQRLADDRPESVIVMNPIYCDEIGRMLREMGVEATLYPV